MEPRLRADAAQNEAALLRAAEMVFGEKGVDAPLDEVIRAAGVGRATLYRRFPTREHLFAAILSDQVEQLTSSAAKYAEAPDSGAAVMKWLGEWEEVGAQYRGMAARLGDGLTEGDGPMARLCAPMQEAFAVLVEHAQSDGSLRNDLSAEDILTLLAHLARDPAGRIDPRQRTVVLDGLFPRR
jgi:AcrR family transcriptional regulator